VCVCLFLNLKCLNLFGSPSFFFSVVWLLLLQNLGVNAYFERLLIVLIIVALLG
jgi:hypothetical protein